MKLNCIKIKLFPLHKMNTKIKTIRRKLSGDLQTPVGIYLKVRDVYPKSALLESSDYHSSDNSFSFIGIEPIAGFSVINSTASMQFPNGKCVDIEINEKNPLTEIFNNFIRNFEVTGDTSSDNGFFGYCSYDVVKYFEDIKIKDNQEHSNGVHDMAYLLYRFVITINQLTNEMTVMENITDDGQSKMADIINLINSRNFPIYDFHTCGEKSSPTTDNEYLDMVRKGIKHCLRGDVFQIVLSRRFEQSFTGDDFKVYRSLRSINPSPYLFYFDFGSYHIFGSSPETHLKIVDNIATIDPIAGTFFRTGNDAKDSELAKQLLEDPKENAEHVMLVDLARNDLSRNAEKVTVTKYKEIQFYSHVIHLVSRVIGVISSSANRIKIFADTFPAGTLSGAPKVRAMQIINETEKHNRGIYGGCIGHIGFEGNINQAITIRSFVSQNNTLYFQAGAGIVSKSDPEKELQEVNNKLGALNRAIEMANNLKN